MIWRAMEIETEKKIDRKIENERMVHDWKCISVPVSNYCKPILSSSVQMILYAGCGKRVLFGQKHINYVWPNFNTLTFNATSVEYSQGSTKYSLERIKTYTRTKKIRAILWETLSVYFIYVASFYMWAGINDFRHMHFEHWTCRHSLTFK